MKCLGRNLVRSWLDFEYMALIPLISKFPEKMAFKLFTLRAIVQYFLDYDWKTYVIGTRFLRERTSGALRRIRPETDEKSIRKFVMRRFIHESHDEYLSCLMSSPKGAAILDRVVIQNLDDLMTIKSSSGIVFVSMHYDAFLFGLTALGRQGLNMYGVNTEAIESEEIPAGVRAYYRHKYTSMERLMNGKVPYVERSTSVFTEVLKKRDCVGLMGDIPGKKSTVVRNLFGVPFRVPLGAWKFATQTGAKLSAYVCLRENGHQYRIETLLPYSPTDDPFESMSPIYDFLESWIREHPDRWTSSYLLEGYEGSVGE